MPVPAMPSTPEGVILRGSSDLGYTLVDLATGGSISAEVFTELQDALTAALNSGAEAVWHENLDRRGRSLGPPTILFKRPNAQP